MPSNLVKAPQTLAELFVLMIRFIFCMFKWVKQPLITFFHFVLFVCARKKHVYSFYLRAPNQRVRVKKSNLGGLYLPDTQSKNIFRPADLPLLLSLHIIEDVSANSDITKTGGVVDLSGAGRSSFKCITWTWNPGEKRHVIYLVGYITRPNGW